MVIVTILNWEYIWKAFQGVLNAASAVESNSVRIGHLKGLAEYYQENPINIITGSAWEVVFIPMEEMLRDRSDGMATS